MRKVLLAFHRTMFEGLSGLFTKMSLYMQSDPPPKSTVLQAQNELANYIQDHADTIDLMPPSLQVTCPRFDPG